MPDLLLELFCEEIPARMQLNAAEELKKGITQALVDQGLTYEHAQAFVTPRRLSLSVRGLPVAQSRRVEDKKGPRVGAPEPAIAGFLKSAGLSSLDEVVVQDDPKGAFYVARTVVEGRATLDVLKTLLPQQIKSLPWPKSMRWGPQSAAVDAPRWVRPLRRIVATFGAETEATDVIPFTLGDVTSDRLTEGHRWHAGEPFEVSRFDDYVKGLRDHFVILDHQERQAIIRHDAEQLAFAQGLSVVEDEGLLREVAGLTEWPVVLMGSFDKAFLRLPEPVIQTTIRNNQKCFVLRDANGKLTNKFLLVANLQARDGGKAIIAGNERVVRARLSDALFFFETDLKVSLESRLEKLKNVTFHQKLGTQYQRVERMVKNVGHLEDRSETLASIIYSSCRVSEDEKPLLVRAARLAKADLTTEMVGEFPELQGFMGRVYAEYQGENFRVQEAIEDHYKPNNVNDRVPVSSISACLSIVDKMDLLAGFWSIDEKPTGSKDPYALRRAAIGSLKVMIENKYNFGLRTLVWASFFNYNNHNNNDLVDSLYLFMLDRYKNILYDIGLSKQVVESCCANPSALNGIYPYRAKLIAEALAELIKSETGINLVAGFKRAFNILSAEKAKGWQSDSGYDANLLKLPSEISLSQALIQVSSQLDKTDSPAEQMSLLATLRVPIDTFFENVIVNDEDTALRANRLRLLEVLCDQFQRVADFSKLEG